MENSKEQLLYAAELADEPLVLRGLVASWPAVQQWRGQAGLKRLESKAGDAVVQVGGQILLNLDSRVHSCSSGMPSTCTARRTEYAALQATADDALLVRRKAMRRASHRRSVKFLHLAAHAVCLCVMHASHGVDEIIGRNQKRSMQNGKAHACGPLLGLVRPTRAGDGLPDQRVPRRHCPA